MLLATEILSSNISFAKFRIGCAMQNKQIIMDGLKSRKKLNCFRTTEIECH